MMFIIMGDTDVITDFWVSESVSGVRRRQILRMFITVGINYLQN